MKGQAMKKLALVLALSAALSGCVSLGKEPPPSLLTLTATATAPAGLSASGKAADALVVIVEPSRCALGCRFGRHGVSPRCR